MARCIIAFLLAEILFATLATLEDLTQIIKHLQAEGEELKRRLDILEDTIRAQTEHIQTQDRRIEAVLENIIESQTDEIYSYSQGLNGQYNSDVGINSISKAHRNGETERGNKHRTSRSIMSTPSPVAFQANLINDTYLIGKHQLIKFDGVTTTVGGGYHSHHGIFTAPTSGIYIFSVSLLLPQNYTIDTKIMKNGQAIKGIFGNSQNNAVHAQTSGTVVLQLITGDEVCVETTESSEKNAALKKGDYTSFMGCLIVET